MLLANSPVQVERNGTCVPAFKLWEMGAVYDPLGDRYDEITDVLIRDVILDDKNRISFTPFRLPSSVPSSATTVSPRQPIQLRGRKNRSPTGEGHSILASQIGAPCIELRGSTITYVALFFACRRTILSGDYLLTSYVLEDFEDVSTRLDPALGLA